MSDHDVEKQRYVGEAPATSSDPAAGPLFSIAIVAQLVGIALFTGGVHLVNRQYPDDSATLGGAILMGVGIAVIATGSVIFGIGVCLPALRRGR